TLEPGKSFTDAATRSAAEREVGELRSSLAQLGGPATRIEAQRIGEITSNRLSDEWTHQDQRFFRNAVAAYLCLAYCISSQRPGRRVQSHRFRQNHLRIFQFRNVCKRRRA